MTTYVLVHGAWHGGWCWRKVARLLKAPGTDLYTPTLTGLGERVHLASPDIDLETHICDVLGVLETEDLRDVVLVGHSYAGIVVSAAADRAAGRVARVVYLDAIVPREGQCLYDCASAKVRDNFEEQARVGGDGWRIPASAATVQFLGLKEETDVSWVMPKLTAHPIRTFREPVKLSANFPQMPRAYINCIGDKPLGQPKSAQAADIEDYHELRTGHDAMVTAAVDLAELLSRIAEGAVTQPNTSADAQQSART